MPLFLVICRVKKQNFHFFFEIFFYFSFNRNIDWIDFIFQQILASLAFFRDACLFNVVRESYLFLFGNKKKRISQRIRNLMVVVKKKIFVVNKGVEINIY